MAGPHSLRVDGVAKDDHGEGGKHNPLLLQPSGHENSETANEDENHSGAEDDH